MKSPNFPTPKQLLPLNLHGGFSKYNQHSLQEIFEQNDIKRAVEIGSWLGLSSSFIASNVKERLYCVDIWEIQEEQAQHASWKAIGDTLYDQFLSNMIHLNLTDKVVPIKLPSQEAVINFNDKVDLVFVDGSHKYENVKHDILEWSKHLEDNGIICGDDWGVPVSDISEGVVRAVKECSQILNKKIETNVTFWRLV